MSENLQTTKRKRGRKNYQNSAMKATSKTITLYQEHFDSIEDNQIHLSEFLRWLIDNKVEEYIDSKINENKDTNSIITTVSIYPRYLDKLQQIDNVSLFIRWGLNNFIEQYTNEKDKGFIY